MATPGPLQTTDTNIMNLASPAIGCFMPQSPKIETLLSVEESVQQDVISFMAPQTADLDEPNAVEKVEVKQVQYWEVFCFRYCHMTISYMQENTLMLLSCK